MCVKWLPSDQRRVLRYYYQANPIGVIRYSGSEYDLLVRWFDKKRAAQDSETAKQTLEQITTALQNQRLLTRTMFADGSGMEIRLTPKGIWLGQRYDSWFSSSGMWFAEYKDHWAWWGLSLLGGIIGAFLVKWLFP